MNHSSPPLFSKALTIVMAFAIFGCNPKTNQDRDSVSSWGPTMPIQLGHIVKWQASDWLSPGEDIHGHVLS